MAKRANNEGAIRQNVERRKKLAPLFMASSASKGL